MWEMRSCTAGFHQPSPGSPFLWVGQSSSMCLCALNHQEQCGLGASHIGSILRAGKLLKEQTQTAHNAACSRAEAQ